MRMNTLIDLKLVHNKVTFWNPVPDSQFLFYAETTIFTVMIFTNPGVLSGLTIHYDKRSSLQVRDM